MRSLLFVELDAHGMRERGISMLLLLFFSFHFFLFFMTFSPVQQVKSWSHQVLITLPDLDVLFVNGGKMAKILVSNLCRIQRTLWDLCAPERNAVEIGNAPSSLATISMPRVLQFT